MARSLATFDEVITVLGGPTAVARICGCRAPNVCHWRTRHGQFPADTYLVITEALAAKGHKAATKLFRIKPPRKGAA